MVTRKRKTSSTGAVDTGEHLFTVVGHSLITCDNTYLTSETFRVGGYDWAILYYPNGVSTVADGQFTSVFLQLVSTIESDVTVSFSFGLQVPASPPPTDEKNNKSFAQKFLPSMTWNHKTLGTNHCMSEKHKKSFTKKFLPSMTENHKSSGVRKFMSKDDLIASECLQDDCLVIKCTVEIPKLIEDVDCKSSIVVPPSNLSNDFRNLLERGLKPDLTVKIGTSESFNVNTIVLGARLPVLRDQLCGSMEGSKASSVCIEDMDAKIFEALLHYMYNDCLPGFMEENTEEATSLAKDLLVPADRYGIERLKVMCESTLSQSLNVNTVSSTLDLAEQYNCVHLKNCCLKYMAADGQRLRTIIGTKGFEQLIKKQPLIWRDILGKVIDKLNPQVATTPASAP
ncbi:unnamed protein product [Alopecurus aequalis]